MSEANHPAAEIVAIALRKIRKVANSRKFAKLSEDCKVFLDDIQRIIPPPGQKQEPAPAVTPTGARAAAASSPFLPASASPKKPVGSAEQASAVSGSATIEASSYAQGVAPDSPRSLGPGVGTATLQGSSSTASTEPSSSQVIMFDSTGLPALSVQAKEGNGVSISQPASPLKSGYRPQATLEQLDGSQGTQPSQAVQPEAAAVSFPDLVPRSETALSDAASLQIVAIMRLAVESQKPEVIEVALDCLQKLIAFRFLQGSVYAITMPPSGKDPETVGERNISNGGSGTLGPGPTPSGAADPLGRTPQAQAIELMCCCDEMPDEKVELQILKGLLTAATSTSFTIHGQALLLAVRTCYNIYLMTRSEVNQTTAKASLTQMLNVVFHRMEADSVMVEVRPIAVTDVLGLPHISVPDASPVTVAVQAFLNNVVMVTGHGMHQSVDEIRSSVAGIFEARIGGNAAAILHTLSDDESEDRRELFVLNAVAGSASAVATGSDTPTKAVLSVSSSASDLRGHKGVTVLEGSGGSTAASSGAAAAGDKGGLAESSSLFSPMRMDELLTSTLQKDAFLVFRALCKLSIRTSDVETLADPTAVRGKVLALELLKILLENSGPTFRNSDKFITAIRNYLCLSLLKNSASSLPQALQLSCSIFLTLMSKFRSSLKAEVGVFFPMILLKPFDAQALQAGAAGSGPGSSSTSVQYRMVVLRCLRELVSDGQLLVDLFVNYDCDLESSNLFERLVNGLVKLAQQPVTTPNGGILDQQEQAMRFEALHTLSTLVESMWTWYRKASGLDQTVGHLEESQPAGTTEEAEESDLASSSISTATAVKGAGGDDGDDLGAKRAYKIKFQEGLALFNKKPKKGIELLQKAGMLGRTAEEVALFLTKTEGLNKTLCGDYLGEREDFNLKVMHAYVDAMDFTDMEFDLSIRQFLNGFRLPGEAQKIDRLMEKFAERYVKCNPSSFKSADVAYVLAYSVIMLNTDAHNPQVKKKMSREAFLKNNRGINDGEDLGEEFMSALYGRISCNEIKMKDDVMAGSAAKGGPAAASTAEPTNIVNMMLKLMGAVNKQVSNEPSDEAIRHTLDYLHQKAKSVNAVTVTEADAVRPMMEVIWAPLLGALSVLFDEYSDPRLLHLCLSGFTAGCSLTAQIQMASLRDIFINSLCNFTHLHSPSTMKYKNALAFKYLLKVAGSVGDHLEDRWVDVLRCCSRWELLQQIASGMPTDAVLFCPDKREDGTLRSAASAIGKGLKRLGLRDGDAGGGPSERDLRSIDQLNMNEASIRRQHIGGSNRRGDAEDKGIPQEVINSVDSHEINRIFLESGSLDSEAIVTFVRALASISADELRDAKAPRVFALTKIIEVAHFNMNRIRLVWSRIWGVLSEYFITVGCHANLQVAMYAVDALRQLAMKFLERDELANYTFQNDFLRPFVVVMRQSQSVEIRELIIRCLSQMVLARVTNVKSGWKSMFMVFTTAAGDKEPNIVQLAFVTIEKIVREHFSHITETETTTFTDCVNCLIAFTNNPHSQDVALNSIAFLRFCALKLAEGAIGDLDALPEGYNANPGVYSHRVLAIDRSTSNAATLHPTTSTSIYPAASESQAQINGHSTTSSSEPPSSALVVPDASGNGMTPDGTRHMKFIDRDEHMYFWFPLLAGLSELTFDPRQEIRHSALEVLFDTLKYHGGTFAESFWKRIFDSVLLPIFDHVRAEVTDTTTFTSEKRRQQEDAWLYETCTKCLQHLVDLFVEFYSEAHSLLSRMLELLNGFMNRSHQSLAAVGVAAFVRLATQAGPLLSNDGWQQLAQSLVDLINEISPNASELVTPPSRATTGSVSSPVSDEITPAVASAVLYSYPSASSLTDAQHPSSQHSGSRSDPALMGSSVTSPTRRTPDRPFTMTTTALISGAPGSSTASAAASSKGLGSTAVPISSSMNSSGSSRSFSLREGVGSRRLVKFRCQAAVQLLLVQGASEIYAKQHRNISPTATATLLHALEFMHQHAHAIDMDTDLRQKLAVQQAEDRVPDERMVVDPPLLRLETEAAHAYLSVLLHISTSSHDPNTTTVCNATQRLMMLCLSTLSRYTLGVTHELHQEGTSHTRDNRSIVVGRTSTNFPILMATPAVEYATFSPLVAASLHALSAFDDATFRKHLPDFFPLMTKLIRAEYAPTEVHRSLAELFLTRIGPLLDSLPPPRPAVQSASPANLQ